MGWGRGAVLIYDSRRVTGFEKQVNTLKKTFPSTHGTKQNSTTVWCWAFEFFFLNKTPFQRLFSVFSTS
jgi:hypothetical protein